MESQTFISCVSWIAKGYASKVPVQMEPDESQMQQLKNNPMLAQQMNYGMDQQSQHMQQGNMPIFGQDMNELAASSYPDVIDDMQDDQKEDYYIQDSDALIVAGKIEKQHSSLEIYIFEQENNNLYLHHQLMMSSFPLSIQWLNVSLSSISSNNHQKGNFAILSTFLPEIQIWNLDQIDAVQPDIILGGQVALNKKKPKKFTNQAKKYKDGSHTDSVLSLTLNQGHKNILASGGADCMVKIWDLNQQKNIYSTNHHKGKVNKVKWNPKQHSIVFATSQDKTLSVLDSRYPDDRLVHKLVSKNQQIESACWNVNQPQQIAYVTDQGNLHLIDVRSLEKPILSATVHPGCAVTDVKIGTKNMVYTCSEDQSVRIWNVNNFEAPLALKKPKCGKMFCLDLIQDQQGPVVCCGNSKGQLFVWDVTENANVNTFWKS